MRQNLCFGADDCSSLSCAAVLRVLVLATLLPASVLLASGQQENRDIAKANLTAWYSAKTGTSSEQRGKRDEVTAFNPHGETFTAEFYRQLGEFALENRFASYLELGCGAGEASRRVVPTVRTKSVLVDNRNVDACQAAIRDQPNAFFVDADLYSSSSYGWPLIRKNGPYDFILVHASHLRDRVVSDVLNLLLLEVREDENGESTARSAVTAEATGGAKIVGPGTQILFPDYGNTKSRGSEPERFDPGVREAVDFFLEKKLLKDCSGFGFFYDDVENWNDGHLAENARQAQPQRAAAAGVLRNSRYALELENGYYNGMEKWVQGWEAILCAVDFSEVEKQQASLLHYRFDQVLPTRPVTFFVYRQLTGFLLNLDFNGIAAEPTDVSGVLSVASHSQTADLIPIQAGSNQISETGTALDQGYFYFSFDGQLDSQRAALAQVAGFDYVFSYYDRSSDAVVPLGGLFDPLVRSVKLFVLETGEYFGLGLDFKELNSVIKKNFGVM
ncbi:unnamed protein product [Amoebophrya sp. A120]|nr:unnamed protein product [Amoebophrya sp. A120]|eukprot:GSA120T00006602001.1